MEEEVVKNIDGKKSRKVDTFLLIDRTVDNLTGV